MRTEVQVAAMNKGLTSKDLILLTYLKENFFLGKVSGINIRNRYPIFFSSSKEISTAFDSLIEKGIVTGEYNRGIITNLSFDEQSMIDIFFNKDRVIKEKKKTQIIKEEGPVTEIIKLYRSFDALPRPAAFSKINIGLTKEALEMYSEDEIRDAISFASTTWFATETWRKKSFSSYSWFLRNIEGFMEGGKYRKKVSSRSSSTIDDLRDDVNDIVF